MGQEGTFVGKYQVKSKIAEGGMGAIYKAKHPTLGRTVILKRLTLKGKATITERFKREAQLMIDFRNDNIVQVYDHFKEGNSYYIVMEYVDGTSLADLIENKRFIQNETAMLIFREICKALKYAHDKNVIHRDIKPENILISKDGEVKLTDFGIATSKDSEDESLTTAGTTLGTPAYMSPEQIADTKRVDKRADIYSMAVVLYKMVTGKLPFQSTFKPDAIAQINKGEYVYPRKINSKITPLIQKVIRKAMHHKVKRRYKDLQQIIDIFTKELKKKYKNKETINAAIKAYLSGTDADLSKIKDTKTGETAVKGAAFRIVSVIGKILIILLIIAVILAAAGFYAYKKDMHYEYLKPNEYGAFLIEIKARTADKDPEDDYITAGIYGYSDKKFEKIENLNFDFSVKDITKNSFIMRSKRIYLEGNYYRLFINYGNVQFQRDFLLSPRILQKVNKDTYDSQKIEFTYLEPRSLPLKIDYSVFDINTSNDITSETEFMIFAGRKWVLWKDLFKLKNYEDILMTGRRHRFKFEKEGYYSESRTVYVGASETVLSLNVSMAPKPGALSLNSNFEGLEVLLNNSLYYISGGQISKYMSVMPTSLKRQEMTLAPGDYFLTVKKSDTNSKTVKAVIVSGKTTIVIMEYNKKDDSINLEIKE